MPSPLAWLFAFLVTAAVETPIVLYLTGDRGMGAGRRAGLIVFAQLATHPLVWFVFPRIAGLTGYSAMALSELWAWLAEAVFYGLVFPGIGASRAIGISALANAASILAGVALHRWGALG